MLSVHHGSGGLVVQFNSWWQQPMTVAVPIVVSQEAGVVVETRAQPCDLLTLAILHLPKMIGPTQILPPSGAKCSQQGLVGMVSNLKYNI